MSLRKDMWKYEQITGESAEHVPIIKLGAFLDGYEMGLEALEQHPCEDCISRKEVLDYLDKMPSELTSDGRRMVRRRTLEEYISDTLPPVTPQQTRWIPCSERMPEDNIHVLCQFTLSGMGECYLAHGVFHVVGGLVMTCNEVIAWMPLPEPYKVESEDENGKL